MTTTPEPSTERPLVTFALFAYNQEDYIREAVEGAFAQTYEPLEIILSDDCSTDRTFEIMQEMAAAYRGLHQVRVRRNANNVGTALHVQHVADAMCGELMVVAAGDDVSVPRRTAVLVAEWEAQGRRAVVLHSEALALHEGETEPSRVMGLRFADVDLIDLEWFSKNRRSPIIAPTAAYSRTLFTSFPPLIGGSLIEDGPMILRGILCGRFRAVRTPLVIVRVMGQSAGRGYTIEAAARWNRFLRSKLISRVNKLQDLASGTWQGPTVDRVNRQIEREILGIARCFVPTSAGQRPAARLRTFLALLFRYPSDGSLRNRLGFALKFCGFWRR
jgi:hypothetical protein